VADTGRALGQVGVGDGEVSFWKGRRVLLTGHTGFKGGWLATWLLARGSRVTGLALPAESARGFFRVCGLEERVASLVGDVRDHDRVAAAFADADPEVVFHLAAQPLVIRGYAEPLLTIGTNVMGTANVLDCARGARSVRAVVAVTSDKCYRPARPARRHLEDDPLGGDDPYSTSKAAAEMVASAYRASFFGPEGRGLATVRAGNVIGGGDWSQDRIVPDAIRAFSSGEPLRVRNPHAVRPWQHVLDPLAGYLAVAERLYADPAGWSEPWNFGPAEDGVSVGRIVDLVSEAWGGGRWTTVAGAGPPEVVHLALDSGKAAARLGWRPRLSLHQGVASTVEWYRAALSGASADEMFALSGSQIAAWEAARA
jgi:CDP-glucose 4,6-dehydratase